MISNNKLLRGGMFHYQTAERIE